MFLISALAFLPFTTPGAWEMLLMAQTAVTMPELPRASGHLGGRASLLRPLFLGFPHMSSCHCCHSSRSPTGHFLTQVRANYYLDWSWSLLSSRSHSPWSCQRCELRAGPLPYFLTHLPWLPTAQMVPGGLTNTGTFTLCTSPLLQM